MKKQALIGFAVIIGIAALLNTPCKAEEVFSVFGKPLTIMGYVQQSIGYGIESGSYNNARTGNYFDSKKGVQQMLLQGLLETKYQPSEDFTAFASGKLNIDWAYGLYSNTNEWENKGFARGRQNLYVLDHTRDILNEAHITWAPRSFFFRVGKQIVAWGETDGFRLMDQWNPVDQRRGLGDVQFENTLLPLWLARAEYNTPVNSTWLQELGFQVVFNPNMEFRGNERIVPGNELFGIWAANSEYTLGGRYPFDYAHVGSYAENTSKPDSRFETKGMEVGARIRGVINDAVVTLNGFYGRDNDVVRKIVGGPLAEVSPFDNRLIFRFPTSSFYPILRFVGATFSRDFPALSSSALGGVAPTWRAEAMYVGSFTTGSELQTFEKSDEFRWMVGADWKVKIDWLNPTAYFFITPQFYHRHIFDYANGIPGVRYTLSDWSGTIQPDNYTGSLMINTSYFHTKLQPMVFWMRDFTGHGNMMKAQVAWEQDHHWKYTLGALFIQGTEKNVNYNLLNHKDQLYFTVAYRF